jgi:release factor glutamine methyltransferase
VTGEPPMAVGGATGASSWTPITVGAALADATRRLRDAGSETARLDAELLLALVLEVGRTTVLAHPDAQIGPAQAAALDRAVTRRAAGEPVAYIRGFKEFRGLAIEVDKRVLIPRPETELLVDLALARITKALTGAPRPVSAGPLRVWDVGTGSGAVPVAIATDLRRRRFGDAVRILGTDASTDALGLALENLVGHGVADIVEVRQGDLLAPRGGLGDDPAADVIVANLPYIPSDVVPRLPIAASFEPRMALDGGADGLDFVRRLLAILPEVLSPGGFALLEIGFDQAEAAMAAAEAAVPGWPAVVHPDLSLVPRVLELQRPVGHG